MEYENMRIGILTWHFYTNVGSFLQALALQNAIHNFGHSVKIVDYRKNSFPKGIKGCIWKVFELLHFLLPSFVLPHMAMKYYQLQQKYMNLSKRVSKDALHELNNEFDAFVCGSDQVWAPNVLDDAYLLSFVKANKKRIAYAPSIGLPVIPENLKPLYKKHISQFSSVSVREKQGAELLKMEFDISAQAVLDPTLLFDYSAWRKLIKIPNINKKSYIFCYFLGNNEWQVEFARQIANREGKKLFIMSSCKEFIKYADKHWFNVKPDLFLGLVSNADKVLTDSFHGMAFSVNFQKDFFFFHRFADDDPINQNSRVDNLANLLGVQDRLIKKDSQVFDYRPVDYETVSKKLQDERQKSLTFLKRALSL